MKHLIKAMNVENKFLNSQMQFGLSKYTTKAKIDYTIDTIVKLVKT